MLFLFEQDDIEVAFSVPQTAKDVLDFTVWITCIEDAHQQASAAFQWAAQFTPDHTVASLREAVGERLMDLCKAIVDSASLSEERLKAIRVEMDRQNGVDPAWKPKTNCQCSMCRRGIETGQPCELDEADALAVHVASRVHQVANTAEPFYVAQVRATLATAEARRMRFKREDDDAKQRSFELLKNHPAAVH